MVATALFIPDTIPIDDSSFKITYNTNSQSLTPLFNGVVQKINRGGDLWNLEASTRAMDAIQANELTAILNQANFRKIRFKLPFTTSIPDATAASGSAGQSLKLSGLANGTALKAGSYLTIEYPISGTVQAYLHQITATATVSGGSATVTVIPAIRRTANLTGATVILNQPYIEGFAASTTSVLSSSNYRLNTYKAGFGIIEVE